MVTIRRFPDRFAALQAKALLESHGLLVYLKNENFSAAVAFLTGTILWFAHNGFKLDELPTSLSVGFLAGVIVAGIIGLFQKVNQRGVPFHF